MAAPAAPAASAAPAAPAALSPIGQDRLDTPEQVAAYERYVNRWDRLFNDYRISGERVHRGETILVWRHPMVPNAGNLPVFNVSQDYDTRGYPTAAGRITDILASPIGDLDEHNRSLLLRAQEVTGWFNNSRPGWAAKKVLGKGGLGLAIHYHYRNPAIRQDPERDIVVKLPIRGGEKDSWQDESIRTEEGLTKRHRRSAHVVQAIDPQVFGLAERVPLKMYASHDDSSDEDVDGYDPNDGASDPRPRKMARKRGTLSQAFKDKKKQEHEDLINTTNDQYDLDIVGRKDFLILEYLENGSLASLVNKIDMGGEVAEEEVRIPNRILWAIWLCMVRACVGMEYPPNMFHEDRRPRYHRPSGAFDISQLTSAAIQALKRVGKTLHDPAQFDSLRDRYGRLQGDLIEEIPKNIALQRRNENLIHFDLDPNNFLFGGFELSDEAEGKWQALLATGHRPLNSTKPRPDRIAREHELTPRLKVSDFGLAQRVKPYKRNIYYQELRQRGKQGFFAPEQFTADWENIPRNANGAEAGEAEIAGTYTYKTNLWQMAWSMWILITKREPPEPPRPQIPRDVLLHIPAGTVMTGPVIDAALAAAGYTGPISYCPMLFDTTPPTYEWVDKDLRETIYQCMYYNPVHRPALQDLLRQAKDKSQEDFNESDDLVRDWNKKWFYDAQDWEDDEYMTYGDDGGGNSGGSGSSGGSGDSGGGESGGGDSGSGDHGEEGDSHAPPIPDDRQNKIIQMNHAFPHGWERIPNAGTGRQCGLQAVFDSLRAQLGNVANDTTLPSMQTLRDLLDQLKSEGAFPRVADDDDDPVESNYTIEQLAVVLERWGMAHGQSLQLVTCIPGNDHVRWRYVPVPTPHADPQIIWIHNDNASSEVGGSFEIIINHFEGIRAQPPLLVEEEVDLDELLDDPDDGLFGDGDGYGDGDM